jgi:hypothetical protein
MNHQRGDSVVIGVVDYILTSGNNNKWIHDGEYCCISPEWFHGNTISRQAEM